MKNNSTGYLVQLDGLRFLAVALVLYDHLAADFNKIRLGHLGVTMFFVLSGFLITRILLSSSDKLRGQEGGLGKYLKRFFIRRTLRIFPVYYLCILILVIFDVPPVREKLGWCVFYATNIYMALNQTWMGVVDHFWSLAVEEQVYLVAPFVIFFIPRKWLIPFFISIIVGAVVFRAYFFLAGYNWVVPYVSTPGTLDAFGLGGLMAWTQYKRYDVFASVFGKTYLVVVGLLLFAGVTVWAKSFPPEQSHNIANEVFERLCGSVFSMFLIGKASLGFSGGMKWFLTNPVSSYLGKISYGIYAYHNLVYNHYHYSPHNPFVRAFHKIERMFPVLNGSLLFEILFFSAITILVSAISWHLMEKPINNLKDRLAI